MFHLHHGLQHCPALEEPGGTHGEAGEAGGHGGQLLATLSRNAGARGHQQTVG